MPPLTKRRKTAVLETRSFTPEGLVSLKDRHAAGSIADVTLVPEPDMQDSKSKDLCSDDMVLYHLQVFPTEEMNHDENSDLVPPT